MFSKLIEVRRISQLLREWRTNRDDISHHSIISGKPVINISGAHYWESEVNEYIRWLEDQLAVNIEDGGLTQLDVDDYNNREDLLLINSRNGCINPVLYEVLYKSNLYQDRILGAMAEYAYMIPNEEMDNLLQAGPSALFNERRLPNIGWASPEQENRIVLNFFYSWVYLDRSPQDAQQYTSYLQTNYEKGYAVYKKCGYYELLHIIDKMHFGDQIYGDPSQHQDVSTQDSKGSNSVKDHTKRENKVINNKIQKNKVIWKGPKEQIRKPKKFTRIFDSEIKDSDIKRKTHNHRRNTMKASRKSSNKTYSSQDESMHGFTSEEMSNEFSGSDMQISKSADSVSSGENRTITRVTIIKSPVSEVKEAYKEMSPRKTNRPFNRPRSNISHKTTQQSSTPLLQEYIGHCVLETMFKFIHGLNASNRAEIHKLYHELVREGGVSQRVAHFLLSSLNINTREAKFDMTRGRHAKIRITNDQNLRHCEVYGTPLKIVAPKVLIAVIKDAILYDTMGHVSFGGAFNPCSQNSLSKHEMESYKSSRRSYWGYDEMEGWFNTSEEYFMYKGQNHRVLSSIRKPTAYTCCCDTRSSNSMFVTPVHRSLIKYRDYTIAPASSNHTFYDRMSSRLTHRDPVLNERIRVGSDHLMRAIQSLSQYKSDEEFVERTLSRINTAEAWQMELARNINNVIWVTPRFLLAEDTELPDPCTHPWQLPNLESDDDGNDEPITTIKEIAQKTDLIKECNKQINKYEETDLNDHEESKSKIPEQPKMILETESDGYGNYSYHWVVDESKQFYDVVVNEIDISIYVNAMPHDSGIHFEGDAIESELYDKIVLHLFPSNWISSKGTEYNWPKSFRTHLSYYTNYYEVPSSSNWKDLMVVLKEHIAWPLSSIVRDIKITNKTSLDSYFQNSAGSGAPITTIITWAKLASIAYDSFSKSKNIYLDLEFSHGASGEVLAMCQLGIFIPKKKYFENINISCKLGTPYHYEGSRMVTKKEIVGSLREYKDNGYTLYGFSPAGDIRQLGVNITNITHSHRGLKELIFSNFGERIQSGKKRHIALEDAIAWAALHTKYIGCSDKVCTEKEFGDFLEHREDSTMKKVFHDGILKGTGENCWVFDAVASISNMTWEEYIAMRAEFKEKYAMGVSKQLATRIVNRFQIPSIKFEIIKEHLKLTVSDLDYFKELVVWSRDQVHAIFFGKVPSKSQFKIQTQFVVFSAVYDVIFPTSTGKNWTKYLFFGKNNNDYQLKIKSDDPEVVMKTMRQKIRDWSDYSGKSSIIRMSLDSLYSAYSLFTLGAVNKYTLIRGLVIPHLVLAKLVTERIIDRMRNIRSAISSNIRDKAAMLKDSCYLKWLYQDQWEEYNFTITFYDLMTTSFTKCREYLFKLWNKLTSLFKNSMFEINFDELSQSLIMGDTCEIDEEDNPAIIGEMERSSNSEKPVLPKEESKQEWEDSEDEDESSDGEAINQVSEAMGQKQKDKKYLMSDRERFDVISEAYTDKDGKTAVRSRPAFDDKSIVNYREKATLKKIKKNHQKIFRDDGISTPVETEIAPMVKTIEGKSILNELFVRYVVKPKMNDELIRDALDSYLEESGNSSKEEVKERYYDPHITRGAAEISDEEDYESCIDTTGIQTSMKADMDSVDKISGVPLHYLPGYVGTEVVNFTMNDNKSYDLTIPTTRSENKNAVLNIKVPAPVSHDLIVPIIRYSDGMYIFETCNGSWLPLSILILYWLTRETDIKFSEIKRFREYSEPSKMLELMGTIGISQEGDTQVGAIFFENGNPMISGRHTAIQEEFARDGYDCGSEGDFLHTGDPLSKVPTLWGTGIQIEEKKIRAAETLRQKTKNSSLKTRTTPQKSAQLAKESALLIPSSPFEIVTALRFDKMGKVGHSRAMWSEVSEGFEVYHDGIMGYMTMKQTKQKIGNMYFQSYTGKEFNRIVKVKTEKKAGVKFGPKTIIKKDIKHSTVTNSSRVRTSGLKMMSEGISKLLIAKYDYQDFNSTTNQAGSEYILSHYQYYTPQQSKTMYEKILAGDIKLEMSSLALKKFIETRYPLLYKSIGANHIDIRKRVIEMIKGTIVMGSISQVDKHDLWDSKRNTVIVNANEDNTLNYLQYGKLIWSKDKLIKTPKGPLPNSQSAANKLGVSADIYRKYTQAYENGKPNGHSLHRCIIDNMATWARMELYKQGKRILLIGPKMQDELDFILASGKHNHQATQFLWFIPWKTEADEANLNWRGRTIYPGGHYIIDDNGDMVRSNQRPRYWYELDDVELYSFVSFGRMTFTIRFEEYTDDIITGQYDDCFMVDVHYYLDHIPERTTYVGFDHDPFNEILTTCRVTMFASEGSLDYFERDGRMQVRQKVGNGGSDGYVHPVRKTIGTVSYAVNLGCYWAFTSRTRDGGPTLGKSRSLYMVELRPWMIDVAHASPNTFLYNTIDQPNLLEKLIGTSKGYGFISMIWRQNTIGNTMGDMFEGVINLNYISEIINLLIIYVIIMYMPIQWLAAWSITAIGVILYYCSALSFLTGIGGLQCLTIRIILTKDLISRSWGAVVGRFAGAPMLIGVIGIHDMVFVCIIGSKRSIMSRAAPGLVDVYDRVSLYLQSGLIEGQEEQVQQPEGGEDPVRGQPGQQPGDAANEQQDQPVQQPIEGEEIQPEISFTRRVIVSISAMFSIQGNFMSSDNAIRDEDIYKKRRDLIIKYYHRKLDHIPEQSTSDRLLAIKYYNTIKESVTREEFLSETESRKRKVFTPETYQGFIVDGIYPYEVDTTDKKHLLSAIEERLVGTKLMPDPAVLGPLLERTDTLYSKLFRRHHMKLPDISFDEYMSTRDNFSATKKAVYRQQFNSAIKDVRKWNMEYTGFLKTGEVYMSTKPSRKWGSKARLVVQAPKDTMGIAPYVAYLITKALFPNIPNIMVGKTSDSIWEVLNSIMSPYKVFISFDNHRHDAHQDTSQHEHNVYRVFERFYDDIKEDLYLWPTNMYNLSRYFSSRRHKIVMRFKGQMRRVMINIMGTTISGNAALTTLGNSLNVWSALTVIIQEYSEINNLTFDPLTLGPSNAINFILAGDDSAVHLPKEHARPFTEFVSKYFYPSKDEEIYHGIGWCCKEVEVHTSDTLKFLSKVFFTSNMRFESLRGIDGLILKSNNYTGSNTTIMKDPLSHQGLVALSQHKELSNTYLRCIADYRERSSLGMFSSKVPDPYKYSEMYSMYSTHDQTNRTIDLWNYAYWIDDLHEIYITYLQPQIMHTHRMVLTIPEGITFIGSVNSSNWLENKRKILMYKSNKKIENSLVKRVRNTELSDYDMFQLSKYFPGKYGNKQTYIPSGEATSSVATTTGIGLSQGTDGNSDKMSDIGTGNYTLIAFWPALSHLAVTGGVIQNQQASGLIVMNTSNIAEKVGLPNFFGYDSEGKLDNGSATYLEMKKLYGYASTTEMKAMVYSATLDLKMVIPAATLTGTMYKGSIRLGQMFSSGNTVTISNLIAGWEETLSGQQSFQLTSALVNDQILGHVLQGDQGPFNVIQDPDLGLEVVSYVILNRPAVSITGGINTTYSLIGTVMANAAIMASPANIILYRLLPTLSRFHQEKFINFPYTPVNTEGIKPPTTYEQVRAMELTIFDGVDYIVRGGQGISQANLRIKLMHICQVQAELCYVNAQQFSDNGSLSLALPPMSVMVSGAKLLHDLITDESIRERYHNGIKGASKEIGFVNKAIGFARGSLKHPKAKINPEFRKYEEVAMSMHNKVLEMENTIKQLQAKEGKFIVEEAKNVAKALSVKGLPSKKKKNNRNGSNNRDGSLNLTKLEKSTLSRLQSDQARLAAMRSATTDDKLEDGLG
jgi:hypothetical protein